MYFLHAQSDEEPVDVMPAIRKACEPKCKQSFSAYRACLDRVKSKGVGACDGQYFDFLHCIDKCVCIVQHSLRGGVFHVLCRWEFVLMLVLLVVSLQSVPQIMQHLK